MKVYFNKQSILLAIGIFVFASYQFQIYWAENSVRDSVLYIEGGSIQRFFIKIFGIFFLYIAIIRQFSIGALMQNFPIKIPILYYILTVIVLIPIFVSEGYPYRGTHLMAVNIVLFTPLLFINFYGKEGDKLFLKLIKITTWVVCIQLLADLIIKYFNLHLVNTILGGMGNANTFGLHLILASLGLKYVYRKYLFSNIILLLVWGTGSLICVLISILLLIQNLLTSINNHKINFGIFILFFIGIILYVLYPDIFNFTYFSLFMEFGPINHAFMKTSNLFIGNISDVGSITGRISMINQAFSLLENNPFAIIFGHPNMMPFWTADSFILTILVTLGLPILIWFLICNFVIIIRGFREKTQISRFASYTILVYLAFFCTNRILDYWPSGFMYLIAFSYLSRKN